MSKRVISKTVVTLSLISLFTDMASEMIYAITPLYLTDMGITIMWIGVIEAVAEIVAGISKGYFGQWSDRIGKRTPFIRAGYTISAFTKPLMAIFATPFGVFCIRIIDRVGKGLRTAPRDAMLAQEATPKTANTVFGFHRSMDTIGAILGPTIILIVLLSYKVSLKEIFYYAFIPSLLAVFCVMYLKEKKQLPDTNNKRQGFFDFFKYWHQANATYKKILLTMLLFFLFNSSDVFLIIKARTILPSHEQVLGCYIFFNVIYALAAYPAGLLADKFHPRTILAVGFMVFAFCYIAISFATKTWHVYGIFGIYGLYAAFTEGIMRAWIGMQAPTHLKGTAIGLFASVQSLGLAVASVVGGILWRYTNSHTLFILSGIVALVVAFITLSIKSNNEQVTH
jgi:MFS family permease